jgi:hypothetical protein
MGMKAVRRGSVLAICALSAIAFAGVPAHGNVAAKKKKPKKPAVVALATATTWLAVAPKIGLTTPEPPPQQITSPTDPLLAQIAPLIQGLAFKGLGTQAMTRITADPADPSRLQGNYFLRAVVFGSAADAQKFRIADIKQVTDAGALKQVGTYQDGAVLDDAKGHVNVMYTIGNVALDLRGTVTETAPGSGQTAMKSVAAAVLANSKKKS